MRLLSTISIATVFLDVSASPHFRAQVDEHDVGIVVRDCHLVFVFDTEYFNEPEKYFD
jgi:hypothetical protein